MILVNAVWYEDEIFLPLRRSASVCVAGSREPLGLDEKDTQKGGTIVTEFSQLSFGFVDSQDCNMLVHIDPPMSDDGEYEDCPFVWL